MVYRCVKCKKEFPLPAKFVVVDPAFNEALTKLEDGQFLSRPTQASGYETKVEIPCCPFCYSKEINERR